VVVAIEEGRRITTNIRAFLRYALSGGVAEVLVMVVAPFVGMGVPLLPGQILWINMLTHGLPGVAFGGQPADPEAMRRPSQSPDEFILGGGIWKQIALIGSAIAMVSLVAGAMALEAGADVATYVFLVLGLSQLAIALSLRTRAPLKGRRRLFNSFTYAVGGAASLQFLAVTWTPLQDLLRTTDISWRALVSLVALACVPSMLVSFVRSVGWAGGPRSHATSPIAPEAVPEDSADAGLPGANLDAEAEAFVAPAPSLTHEGDQP
jgi:Ca2+-transporting ATPase